jgi:ERCC4-type nuclease
MFKLTVDDRETKIIPHLMRLSLDKNNIILSVERITCGDYVVSWNGYVIFIIERKTLADMAASIKDGRKNNTKNLFKVKEQFPLCKIIYLIEGAARPSSTKKIGGIQYKNLQAHMDHLIQRDGIFIIYSKNNEDTAARLIEFIRNYSTIQPSPLAELPTTGGEISVLKDTHKRSDLDIIYNIWCCVPYITTKTATLFIDAKLSIGAFLRCDHPLAEKKSIYTMKYPNGTIIGKRADKIVKIQDLELDANRAVYAAMLACLAGITKKTALLVLETYSFADIINNRIPHEQISNIKKSSSRSIGNKAVDAIFKYFVN